MSNLYTLFQALYYCIPFREQLLEYSANYKNPGEAEENLLTCLADLFTQVKKTSLSDILLHFLCCCSLVCISVLPLSLSSRCTHGFHVIVFGKNKNIVTLKIIHFTSSVSLLIDWNYSLYQLYRIQSQKGQKNRGIMLMKGACVRFLSYLVTVRWDYGG
jgi:hypothetical protein